jgi:RNA polymerase sigma-70 factor (ECF subfamily)
MADRTIDTVVLQGLLDRMRAGDTAARDELVRTFYARLERLTQKMLRAYPRLRSRERPSDVLQGAAVRLLRALEDVPPESPRALLGLAALQIRRELLNLARHHARHAVCRGDPAGLGLPPADVSELPAPDEDPEELEQWAAFHAGVEALPDEEREVVGLVFYHGCRRVEAARVLGITYRVAKSRWRSALAKLRGMADQAG